MVLPKFAMGETTIMYTQMKRLFNILLFALLFSATAVADPGPGTSDPGGVTVPLPGGGVVVIRPTLDASASVQIDSQSGSVIVWATPAQPVNVRMVELESGIMQEHYSIMPDVLQFQEKPDVVYITEELNGEVVLYAWHKEMQQ